MLTKVPDVGVICVTVPAIGVLLIVLLVDPVAVCPVVVVSGTVDDVGCGDCVVNVIGVDSVTGIVQTYVTYMYTICKCFVSFVQRLVVFRTLEHMIFILQPKCQRCPYFCLFTIVHISAEKRP